MRRLILFVLALLLMGSARPAAAQFGKLMDRVKKVADAVQPWSPEQEQAIGAASAAKLIHIFGLYEKPEMVQYVNLVGNAVARQSSRQIPYHFAILDTDVITAVALPGGYVFITRGALANMSDESQLAGTLAHEVEHVAGRHLENEVQKKKLFSLGAEEGTSRIPAPAQLQEIGNKIVTQALTMQYSRDKESEADRKGTQAAARAGYDPAGLRNFLTVLEQHSSEPGSHRALALWGNTHPPLAARIASLDSVLKGMNPGGQTLAERYQKNVDFAEKPAAEPNKPAATAPKDEPPDSASGRSTAGQKAAAKPTAKKPRVPAVPH